MPRPTSASYGLLTATKARGRRGLPPCTRGLCQCTIGKTATPPIDLSPLDAGKKTFEVSFDKLRVAVDRIHSWLPAHPDR